MIQLTTKSPKETIQFGGRLAKLLNPGDIVCLSGDLGSGKTTLVKGIAKGVKINPTKVNSPTFVLMNTYEGTLPLYHFDLYRLNETRDIPFIGYEEFFYGKGLTVVEWAERLGSLYPKEYLKVSLEHTGDDQRTIRCTAQGQRYQNLLKKL